jgi:hypothetical protein
MATVNNAQSRLNASSSVTADNLKDLGDVKSSSMQAFIKKLSSLVDVRYLGTDGYNDDQGNAGCEIFFRGTSPSSVSYGEKVLDQKALASVGSLVASAKFDVAELTISEGLEFLLVISGSSD